MGCFQSSGAPETESSKSIAKSIAQKRAAEAQVKKLLLLGAGGSGKSTFFKQLNEIHGKALSDEERKKYKEPIYDNVITCIQFCLDKMEGQGKLTKQFMSGNLLAAAKYLLTIPSDSSVNEKIASHINLLWADKSVVDTFVHYTEREGDGTIHPSTRWFFDSIERISSPDYIPTKDDVIRVRFRTTGIVEQDFKVTSKGQTLYFRMYDVGGQQSERRKWIHCFENVTGVLFVSSLCGYNEKMWEDSDKNRMVDSLELFKNICNSRWFKDSAMIVFMNKWDLFQKRIKEVPLTVCPYFEDFPERKAKNPKECVKAIREKFQAQKTRYKKDLFIHATIAISDENVKKIFDSVRMQILRDNLAACGLA